MKRVGLSFLVLGLFLFNSSGYAINLSDIKLTPRVSIFEVYDDNITSASTNTKEDFITTVNLGLDLDFLGKTEKLTLSGTLTQQLFSKESDFNNTSESISASFDKEFSKYDRISIKDTFTHSQDPSSFEDEFGRTSGKYSYYRNRVNLSYTKDINKNLSLIMKYANEYYNDTRASSADSYYNSLGLEADYYLNSSLVLLSEYNFSIRKFDPGNDSTTNNLTAGIRKFFTPQIYLDAKAGIDFIDTFSGKNLTKPEYILILTDEIDETTVGRISFTKSYSTNSSTADIFDNWRITATYSKQLLQRLTAFLDAFYGKGTYETLAIEDTLKGASIGFSYDLTKNSKFVTKYSYSETSSNIATREYTKNMIYVGMDVAF